MFFHIKWTKSISCSEEENDWVSFSASETAQSKALTEWSLRHERRQLCDGGEFRYRTRQGELKEKKHRFRRCFFIFTNQVYKPCSVKRRSSIFALCRHKAPQNCVPPGKTSKDLSGKQKSLHTVLLRIGFTPTLCYHRLSWALTSRFHPYSIPLPR